MFSKAGQESDLDERLATFRDKSQGDFATRFVNERLIAVSEVRKTALERPATDPEMACHLFKPWDAVAQRLGDMHYHLAINPVLLGQGQAFLEMLPEERPDMLVAHAIAAIEIGSAYHNCIKVGPMRDRTTKMRLQRSSRTDWLVHELDSDRRKVSPIRIAPQRNERPQRRFMRKARALAFGRAAVGPEGFLVQLVKAEYRVGIEEPRIALEPLDGAAQCRRRPHGKTERPEILAPHRCRSAHVERNVRPLALGQCREKGVVLTDQNLIRRISELIARKSRLRERPVGLLRIGLRDGLGRKK